jgi:peptidoglycan/LPS O-acetylase OafA/YrhL
MEAIVTPRSGDAESAATMSRTHSDDVPGLTGLRFLAAFSVLIAHAFGVLMQGHDAQGVVYWLTKRPASA